MITLSHHLAGRYIPYVSTSQRYVSTSIHTVCIDMLSAPHPRVRGAGRYIPYVSTCSR